MEEISKENPSYPPDEENSITKQSEISFWDVDPFNTLYDDMYKLFPKRREDLYEIKYKKIPNWRYKSGRLIVKTISDEDLPYVNKLFTQEYVLCNVLWQKFRIRHDIGMYFIYRDILMELIPEENSFMAIAGGEPVGLLLATLRNSDKIEKYGFYDRKLAQVMKGGIQKLWNLLTLSRVKKWLYLRFLVTSSDVRSVDKSEIVEALLKSFWSWAITKEVDCVLAANTDSEHRRVFTENGYIRITLKDDDSLPCFFVRFINNDCVQMFNYTQKFI